MSDLLGLGSAALAAYRTALTAIGENVANAETPGYSRREVRLNEATAPAVTTVHYQDTLDFGGVRVAGVQRAWDNFRAADARISATAHGRTDARQTWLINIETVLDDGTAGVGAELGTFFNAGTTLAASPDDPLGRQAMLMKLEDVAGAYRTTAAGLARISEGIANQAGLEVDALNIDLDALAKVNTALRQAGKGTPTEAALLDRRDQLLDSIAGRLDIDARFDARGVVTVSMAGAPTKVLVDGAGPSRLALDVAADGRLSLRINDSGTVGVLPVSGGSLAGLIDSATVTADRRAELDQQAQAFATALNNWQAQGRTANGNAGVALLDAAGGAASMRLLSSDPAAIAAASADGTANGNLNTLADLRGTGGAEARWAALVGGHSLLVSSAKSEAKAAAAQRDNSFAARDLISGVDLDQEAAELMRFQQAYNGAAKIVQVARETMQSILDIF